MCSVLPRDTLIPLDAGESQAFITVSFPDPPHQVELRSSGGAGEGHGCCMGIYQLLPEHRGQGGGATYRQLHDTNDQHCYLYRFGIVIAHAQPWRLNLFIYSYIFKLQNNCTLFIQNILCVVQILPSTIEIMIARNISNFKSKSQHNVLITGNTH